MMRVIPAIDIKDGKCVRLYKGDFEKSKIYADNPIKIAKQFERDGAKLIHVVDLDGAKEGHSVNTNVITEIAFYLDIPIQVGGGIRTKGDANYYLAYGIKRIVIGTKVLEDMDFLKNINPSINVIPDIAFDDGKLLTHGWTKKTKINYKRFLKKLKAYNIKEIIVTDKNKDGTMDSPNFDLYEKIQKQFPEFKVIASGGIFDIVDLEKLNTDGAIIGTAIYEQRINLKRLYDNKRFNN